MVVWWSVCTSFFYSWLVALTCQFSGRRPRRRTSSSTSRFLRRRRCGCWRSKRRLGSDFDSSTPFDAIGPSSGRRPCSIWRKWRRPNSRRRWPTNRPTRTRRRCSAAEATRSRLPICFSANFWGCEKSERVNDWIYAVLSFVEERRAPHLEAISKMPATLRIIKKTKIQSQYTQAQACWTLNEHK